MLKIDAHQHFWKYDPVRDSWINNDMSVLQRDFFPEHLDPILKQHGIAGCVVVQSDQSKEENDFQLLNAAMNDFVRGVVGWVDFRSPDIDEQLAYYSQFDKMKGFRHMLQSEAQRDLMLSPDFKRGIGLLTKYHFAYDVLVLTDQLEYTKAFVACFPEQPFVINHLAKPMIKAGLLDQLKRDIQTLAVYDHVHCKLSGMTTEADWHHWQDAEIRPYMDVVVEAFGIKRIMFGSDWPVCLLAGSYEQTLGVVERYFSDFSEDEKNSIFGGNAIRFYNL